MLSKKATLSKCCITDSATVAVAMRPTDSGLRTPNSLLISRSVPASKVLCFQELFWELHPHSTSLFPQQPMNFTMSRTRDGRKSRARKKNAFTKPYKKL